MAERRLVGDTGVRGWKSADTTREPGQVARFVPWLCLAVLATLSLVPPAAVSLVPAAARPLVSVHELVTAGLGKHAAHLAAYCVAAFTVALLWGEHSSARTVALLVPFAGVLELLQGVVPWRALSFGDFASSSAGVLAGVAACVLLRVAVRRWPIASSPPSS
jgi:uncharacterized membrane protein